MRFDPSLEVLCISYSRYALIWFNFTALIFVPDVSGFDAFPGRFGRGHRKSSKEEETSVCEGPMQRVDGIGKVPNYFKDLGPPPISRLYLSYWDMKSDTIPGGATW